MSGCGMTGAVYWTVAEGPYLVSAVRRRATHHCVVLFCLRRQETLGLRSVPFAGLAALLEGVAHVHCLRAQVSAA